MQIENLGGAAFAEALHHSAMSYLRWGKQHAADVNKFKLCAFVSLLEDFTDWEGVFGNTILLNILDLL